MEQHGPIPARRTAPPFSKPSSTQAPRSPRVALLGEFSVLEDALLGLEGLQHVRHQRRQLVLDGCLQDELPGDFLGRQLPKPGVLEDSLPQSS